MEAVNNQKLSMFRELLQKKSLDAYLVFHFDAHQSEYLAPCDERIAHISGFKGSNGICYIDQTQALMWTDGRYYLQAQRQLEAGWEMKKMELGQKSYFEHISTELAEKPKVIGVDPYQIPTSSYNLRSKYFKEQGIDLVTVDGGNLVDLVWATSRPLVPQNKVFVHDTKYSGRSVEDKYKLVREKLASTVDSLLVTTLDDIAWLLNLRGTDIAYNPIFFSYAIVDIPKDQNERVGVRLFIDESKVADVLDHLKENNVSIHKYDDIEEHLKILVAEGKIIGFDEASCNYRLYSLIKEASPVNKENVIQHLKAVKSAQEMEGMRNCNIRDCAALMKYFGWLENELNVNGNQDITEYTAAKQLLKFREEGDIFKGPSFDTISSIGPNGAVIHYKPDKDTALKVNNKEVYLLDSGGQYLDGTTDITRTVHFNGAEPTAFQKEMYTRVLLGTLDLERVVWPSNSSFAGADFDVLARRRLWEVGRDYKHGTGHGVGSFLCVHEGPQGIGRYSKVKLVEGMCVSDEPGYYEDGEFGIRIENVVMVVKSHLPERFKFENLTVAPYCRELIDKNVLDKNDIEYIDKFHQTCLEKLTPLLQDNELGLNYLKRQCQPL